MTRRRHNWPNHIVLLDDDVLSARLVLRLFTHAGFPVTHCDDFKQSWQLCQENPGDLVIMNLAFMFKEYHPNHHLTLRNPYFASAHPVIYYTPDLVIDDLLQTISKHEHTQDGQWMLDCQLYRFFLTLE